MTRAADYILLSEISIARNHLEKAIKAWHAINTDAKLKQLYTNWDANTLLEISALKDPKQAIEVIKAEQLDDDLAVSDWRRQLLILKDQVKPQQTAVPQSRHIQLRHIEVPLNVYGDYLAWRDRTIFPHVSKQTNIDAFTAYHSLLSSEPGVMFISSFSCDIEQYLECFSGPAYQDIVKQAGTRFICGGENGLYTTIYRQC